MAHQSTTSRDETPEDLFHDQHLGLQGRMQNPIVFHAKMMGDIMYYHQALQQPDAKQFAKAVVKEVNGHVENKHWELVKQEEVPEDAQVMPSVWSMRLRQRRRHRWRRWPQQLASAASSSTGLFIKLILLLLIPKLQLRWISIWNFLKAFILRLETPRTTCSNF